MCLFTNYIENPKYRPNRKNGYNPPKLEDMRLKYVPTKCGRCIECRKEKKRMWIARLSEEIRVDEKALFVTLTFNNTSLEYLSKETFGRNYTKNNEELHLIVTKAVRRFLELIRKHTKKSIKHWLITEKGEDFERIHLHGIIWCDKKLLKHWRYGYSYIGTFVNEQTINYITKYMLKVCEKDKTFIGKIFTSKGIGETYVEREGKKRNRYQECKTIETYRTRKGIEVNLPQYYRLKIYNEEEREKLWIQKQEQGYRYIAGEKVSTEDIDTWENLTNYYQSRAKRLYNDDFEEWQKEKQIKRLQKMKAYRDKERTRVSKTLEARKGAESPKTHDGVY